jgi:hypothetical protein
MQRAGALAAYGFSAASLQAWALAEEHMVLGAANDQDILAAGVFLISGTRAEFHLAASHPEARHLSSWLLAQSITRLKSMGIRTLNMGGGVRRGDGLYLFKQKFGGKEVRLWILKEIYNAITYRAQCELACTSEQESWFPAYRSTNDRRSIAGSRLEPLETE